MWTWVEWSVGGGVLVCGVLLLLGAFWWCLRSAGLGSRPLPPEPARFPAPPLGLPPAQLRYSLEVCVAGIDILATLLDLAVRGVVAIQVLRAQDGTWAGFELRTAGASQHTNLQPFEALLVEDLFGGGRTAQVKEVVENELLADDLEAALREDAVRRGWLPAGHLGRQHVWRLAGVALVVAGVPALFLFALGFVLGPCLLPLPLLGLLALILGWRLPGVTPAGQEIADRAYAYQHDLRGLLSSVPAAADPATPALLLPYAITFGMSWQWLGWARRAAPSCATGFWGPDGNQVPVGALEQVLPAFLSYEGRVFVDRWHQSYWGPVVAALAAAMRSGRGSSGPPTMDAPPMPPP